MSFAPPPYTRAWFVHRFFDLAILGKAIDGLLEVIGAVLLFAVNKSAVVWLAKALTQYELAEDPNDAVAQYIVHAASAFGSGQLLAFLYLFTHGLIKLGLVAALYEQKLWAYPLANAFFGLFALYELYKYALSGAVIWLVLLILDLFVILFTWLEGRRVRRAIGQAE